MKLEHVITTSVLATLRAVQSTRIIFEVGVEKFYALDEELVEAVGLLGHTWRNAPCESTSASCRSQQGPTR